MNKEDYYLNENGYICFTEKYLLKRGFCCSNNCKHCPYGRKPNITEKKSRTK